MTFESKIQIGKNGLTQGVINSLNLSFKTHDQIRISVLKAADRDKVEIVNIAEKILGKVNYYCSFRIIGFTIILRKKSAKLKLQKHQEKSL